MAVSTAWGEQPVLHALILKPGQRGQSTRVRGAGVCGAAAAAAAAVTGWRYLCCRSGRRELKLKLSLGRRFLGCLRCHSPACTVQL